MSLSGSSEGSLELELSCPICLNLFSNPVSLPCGHIYCLACLQRTMPSRGPGEPKGPQCCPECREEYPGPEALRRNLKLSNIVETYKANVRSLGGVAEIEGEDEEEEEGVFDQNDECCTCFQTLTSSGRGTVGRIRNTGSADAPVSPSIDPGESKKLGGGLGVGVCDPIPVPRSGEAEQDGALGSETDERRVRLAGLATYLTARLSAAEDTLAREAESEAALRAVNSDLRSKVAGLLEEMVELVRGYGVAGLGLLEAELRPGEEALEARVRRAADLRDRLKAAQLRAGTLLREREEAAFAEALLMAEPLEGDAPTDTDGTRAAAGMRRACAELERGGGPLRAGLAAAQRALRALLDPSEVTLDPDTLHPSLVLSEDMKSVSFSVAKQPYPPCATRFVSFLQALSAQSFWAGEHRWGVDTEGCPWVLGMCYSGGLARSGVGSGLESSAGAWCLMWCDGLLRAYERGHGTPLIRTPALRRVEIRLSFRSRTLAFYSVSSLNAAKTHLHTFNADFTEPVYLAVRMMSGQPKARITVSVC